MISNCVINLSTDKPAVLDRDRPCARSPAVGSASATSSPRTASAPTSAPSGELRRLHRGALSKGEYEAGLEAAGFEEVTVEFTHQVADGMHGAIVKAVKTHEPAAKGLPVVQPATNAGCC